jgi:hypothetical protein
MTVFDRLEAQLLDAHPHRARRALPRPAPRHMLAFVTAIAAVGVVAIAGLAGGSGTSSQRPAAQPRANTPAVVPADIEVAVLNSTRTPGLARDAAYALQRHGWKIGTVTNVPDQNKDASCIEFTRGHARAASQIAEQLGIDTVLPVDTVTPVDDIFQRLAGPTADVIVVVGRDRVRRPGRRSGPTPP